MLFDLPRQVELSTNHNSLKRIIDNLGKNGFRVRCLQGCLSLIPGRLIDGGI